WNIFVFYFFVLQTPPWVNGCIIIILSILVFVPIRYVYPSRTPRYRALTNSLGTLWAVSIVLMIYFLPEPPRYIVFASLIFPAYYTALSFWLEWKRLTAGPRTQINLVLSLTFNSTWSEH